VAAVRPERRLRQRSPAGRLFWLLCAIFLLAGGVACHVFGVNEFEFDAAFGQRVGEDQAALTGDVVDHEHAALAVN
jgi:hypothetical protein